MNATEIERHYRKKGLVGDELRLMLRRHAGVLRANDGDLAAEIYRLKVPDTVGRKWRRPGKRIGRSSWKELHVKWKWSANEIAEGADASQATVWRELKK